MFMAGARLCPAARPIAAPFIAVAPEGPGRAGKVPMGGGRGVVAGGVPALEPEPPKLARKDASGPLTTPDIRVFILLISDLLIAFLTSIGRPLIE